MGKAKQVMDIKVSKGIAQSSNEELRKWTEKGWEQAMKEGNYDRSRTHLNFEIRKGGIVTAVDKNYPLQNRMAEKLAERGIKDPNEGLTEPRFRTVVNFIFGGSTDRMREMAFGEQKVDFDSKDANGQIKRMPDIEQWAKDIYDFVADKYGEKNIISFIVHLDEKNPHVHCAVMPIDKDERFNFKKLFHGENKLTYKNYMFALHDELSKVNEKWGLTRGISIVQTGVKHRSTEDYRRWLKEECMTLEEQRANTAQALRDVNVELAIAVKKHKSFNTMIENLKKKGEELEKQLHTLKEMKKNSQDINNELAQKIQRLENQKADVEMKLVDKLEKLRETNQLLDTLRKDKNEIEELAKDMQKKANDSELSWAHSMSYHMNTVVMDTLASEFINRFSTLPSQVKESFDGTLLKELAEEGNHVIGVALNLICGFVDNATTIAQSHGGGGGGDSSGWGRDPEDDDQKWARKCLARAREMCKPAQRRKNKI